VVPGGAPTPCARSLGKTSARAHGSARRKPPPSRGHRRRGAAPGRPRDHPEIACSPRAARPGGPRQPLSPWSGARAATRLAPARAVRCAPGLPRAARAPHAPAIQHDQDQASTRNVHGLPQCRERILEKFHRRHEQNQVDRGVGERQPMRITEDRGDFRVPCSHLGEHPGRSVNAKHPKRGRHPILLHRESSRSARRGRDPQRRSWR
jgi:hypothetical protein